MNENENICPKCQTARTELKGGLVYCSNCGFEGEEKKPELGKVTSVNPAVRRRLWLYFGLIIFATPELVLFILAKGYPQLAALCGLVGLVAACGLFARLHATASPTGREQIHFWLVMLAPSFVSLLTLLLGRIEGLGQSLAIFSLPTAIFASVYCGKWLTDHYFSSSSYRGLVKLLFTLGIGFLNLMIIFGGCTQANL